MRSSVTFLFLLSATLLAARDYVVPANANVARFFAELPEDATVVRFSEAAEYRCGQDIVLPD
ncbi:MAG: hypothetical protein KDB96_16570, partial [Flavobacteriales bacterium]|nr:hypothetical protein [Flavobacteriales bacterium]